MKIVKASRSSFQYSNSFTIELKANRFVINCTKIRRNFTLILSRILKKQSNL